MATSAVPDTDLSPPLCEISCDPAPQWFLQSMAATQGTSGNVCRYCLGFSHYGAVGDASMLDAWKARTRNILQGQEFPLTQIPKGTQ